MGLRLGSHILKQTFATGRFGLFTFLICNANSPEKLYHPYPLDCMSPKNRHAKGGRHSSVVLSTPTIMRPGFESQAHHLCLFNCVIGIVMRKGRK